VFVLLAFHLNIKYEKIQQILILRSNIEIPMTDHEKPSIVFFFKSSSSGFKFSSMTIAESFIRQNYTGSYHRVVAA